MNFRNISSPKKARQLRIKQYYQSNSFPKKPFIRASPKRLTDPHAQKKSKNSNKSHYHSFLGIESKFPKERSPLGLNQSRSDPEEKENSKKHWKDLEAEYGFRNVEMLYKKRLSNYKKLMNQIRQLMKIRKLQAILDESKQVKKEIFKLQMQCRKLKLTKLKFRSKNKQRSLRTKTQRKITNQPISHSQTLRKQPKTPTKPTHKKKQSEFDLNGDYDEDRKRLLEMRKQVAKRKLKSSQRFYGETVELMSAQINILSNELCLLNSQISRDGQIIEEEPQLKMSHNSDSFVFLVPSKISKYKSLSSFSPVEQYYTPQIKSLIDKYI